MLRGDVATQESLAAAWLLRKHLPEMKVRVVNIVDLMRLFHPQYHPHGMLEKTFVNLFTTNPMLSSRFMATRERFTKCCMAVPIPNASTCVVTWRRVRQPRHSTCSCATA